MSRISQRFEELKKTGRKALIPYVTAGDPDPAQTVPLLHALVDAGADIVEIGVPFSDPMAEGPVIQRAMERALAKHVTLTQVLGMVRTFRQQDATTPVVLMGYLNPIEVMGYPQFASAASQAGVDGVLIVDMPPEEAEALLTQTHKTKLDVIFLISPTTTDARIQRIAGVSGGFVYYVSLKGITGAAHLDAGVVQQRVRHIKSMVSLPVGVGFGIADAPSAQAVSQVADAVVVGSALVKQIEANQHDATAMTQAVTRLLQGMRAAMDAPTAASRVAGV
jgi:tryptophan synthase alpha chain